MGIKSVKNNRFRKFFAIILLLFVFIFFGLFTFLTNEKIKQIGPTGFSIATYVFKKDSNLNLDDYKVPKQINDSFEYINDLRKAYGKDIIEWDVRAYNLAVDRSRDMYQRRYDDHVTPEGKCAKDFKIDYGFDLTEILAENIGGMTHYTNGTPIETTSPKEPIDNWMASRGHRYNLLYDEHISGAIGCYKHICVFYGVHRNIFGLGGAGCVDGDYGYDFWESSGKQKGEV